MELVRYNAQDISALFTLLSTSVFIPAVGNGTKQCYSQEEAMDRDLT
jgi:hypothetical protein